MNRGIPQWLVCQVACRSVGLLSFFSWGLPALHACCWNDSLSIEQREKRLNSYLGGKILMFRRPMGHFHGLLWKSQRRRLILVDQSSHHFKQRLARWPWGLCKDMQEVKKLGMLEIHLHFANWAEAVACMEGNLVWAPQSGCCKWRGYEEKPTPAQGRMTIF